MKKDKTFADELREISEKARAKELDQDKRNISTLSMAAAQGGSSRVDVSVHVKNTSLLKKWASRELSVSVFCDGVEENGRSKLTISW